MCIVREMRGPLTNRGHGATQLTLARCGVNCDAVRRDQLKDDDRLLCISTVVPGSGHLLRLVLIPFGPFISPKVVATLRHRMIHLGRISGNTTLRVSNIPRFPLSGVSRTQSKATMSAVRIWNTMQLFMHTLVSRSEDHTAFLHWISFSKRNENKN
jgi:hypothetical protein